MPPSFRSSIFYAFERSTALLKLISNLYLELHIVEYRIVLMFTNSLNFLSKENRKRTKIEHGDMKGIFLLKS